MDLPLSPLPHRVVITLPLRTSAAASTSSRKPRAMSPLYDPDAPQSQIERHDPRAQYYRGLEHGQPPQQQPAPANDYAVNRRRLIPRLARRLLVCLWRIERRIRQSPSAEASPALAPCPFCASQHIIILQEHTPPGHRALCRDCGMQTPWFHKPSIAAAAWNRRVINKEHGQ